MPFFYFWYGDLAPFLKWSRYYSGITSLRVKIVEPNNHLSLIITLAVYLGDDNYDNLKPCFQLLYKQLSKLKCVKLYGKQISVLYRCVCVGGDGKQRREETGNSSAKSTYPVPECPEHKQQLGNMKIVCPEPVWSVEDTNMLATDYHNWLSGKPDSNVGRRQFAKLHRGN